VVTDVESMTSGGMAKCLTPGPRIDDLSGEMAGMETNINLRDPAINPDHIYETLAELREQEPVTWSTVDKSWLVCPHKLVREAFSMPATFSSEGISQFGTERIPSLECDPPEHARFRALMAPHLALPRIKRLEPEIRAQVSVLLGELPRDEAVDLIPTVAAVLPMLMILKLTGLTDRDEAAELERRLRSASDYVDPANAEKSFRDLLGALGELIDSRRRRPRDDVASQLAAAEFDGRPLDRSDVVGLITAFLFAGHHTTIAAIGLVLYRLVIDPELFESLPRDSSSAGAVAEETLRLDPPVQMFPRNVAQDWRTETGDRIPSGARANLVIAAANRDPRELPEPDRFDLGAHEEPRAYRSGSLCQQASFADEVGPEVENQRRRA
jgi:cytochrome P450